MNLEFPLKMLIYSPAGHGKTTLLSTGADDPRLSPMLFLEFEGGTRSIRSKVRLLTLKDLENPPKPVPGKIDVLPIREWADFNAAYAFLAQEKSPYKSVCLDSLSEMNYLNMSEVLEAEIRANPKHDPDIAEQRDYLRSSGQMRKLIRYFRDLPIHVFFSAGAQTLQDPRTKKMELWPQLTGKLAREVPHLVEIVGYLAIAETEEGESRVLVVDSTSDVHAKDRTEGGLLGGMVWDPTLPKIMDLVEGVTVAERGGESSGN